MRFLQRVGWYGSNVVQAIEIVPGRDSYRWGLIRKQGDDVRLLQTQNIQGEGALLDVLAAWPGVPIVFAWRGHTKVEKLISKEADPVSDTLGVRVENRKQFVYQQLPSSGAASWTAVVRYEELTESIARWKTSWKRTIYVCITPAVVAFLIPGVSEYQPDKSYLLQIDGQNYGWSQGLTDTPNQGAEILTEDRLAWLLSLHEDVLYIYAAAYQFFLSRGADVENMPAWSEHRRLLRDTWLQLRATGITAAFLVCLLVLCTAGSTYIGSEVRGYRALLQSNAAALAQIHANEIEIRRQSSFVSRAEQDALAGSHVAYLTGQMASLAPPSLHFDRLIYKPDKKSLRQWLPEASETASPDVIVIGSSENSQSISLFSIALESLATTKSAEIRSEAYDFRSRLHTFILTVELEDE